MYGWAGNRRLGGKIDYNAHWQLFKTIDFSQCHTLHMLRAHGMTTSSIHMIFKAVVVATLIYAASSWCGFAIANDRCVILSLFLGYRGL